MNLIRTLQNHKKSIMKNSFNPESGKNQFSPLTIRTKLHKPGVLKNIVERLADRRIDFGYRHEKVQPGWLAVDSSSTEAFVSGELNISSELEHIYSSFLTNFFFTCTKDSGEPYKLLWVSSLS